MGGAWQWLGTALLTATYLFALCLSSKGTRAEMTVHEVASVAATAGAQTVAIGGVDGNLIVWDTVSGNVTNLSGHSDWVHDAVISADDEYLVTASLDKTAKLWEISTGTLIETLNHPSQVFSVDIPYDNAYILSAAKDNTTRLWNISTGAVEMTYPAGGVKSAVFSKDTLYTYVATGSRDKLVRLFDRKTAAMMKVFSGHRSEVKDVRLGPSGKYLASRALDGSARLWDVVTGATLVQYTSGNPKAVWDLDFTPDEAYLVTGEKSGNCTLWELTTGTSVWNFVGHEGSVRSLQVTSDGAYFVSGDKHGTVRIWDIATGAQLNLFDYSAYRSAK